METRTEVVTPGLPYVYNIVVMGMHVQSMSLASCAVFCWKDKTEFTVQQSAECAHTSSRIYRRMSHARCKTTGFVRGLVCRGVCTGTHNPLGCWASIAPPHTLQQEAPQELSGNLLKAAHQNSARISSSMRPPALLLTRDKQWIKQGQHELGVTTLLNTEKILASPCVPKWCLGQ